MTDPPLPSPRSRPGCLLAPSREPDYARGGEYRVASVHDPAYFEETDLSSLARHRPRFASALRRAR